MAVRCGFWVSGADWKIDDFKRRRLNWLLIIFNPFGEFVPGACFRSEGFSVLQLELNNFLVISQGRHQSILFCVIFLFENIRKQQEAQFPIESPNFLQKQTLKIGSCKQTSAHVQSFSLEAENRFSTWRVPLTTRFSSYYKLVCDNCRFLCCLDIYQELVSRFNGAFSCLFSVERI